MGFLEQDSFYIFSGPKLRDRFRCIAHIHSTVAVSLNPLLSIYCIYTVADKISNLKVNFYSDYDNTYQTIKARYHTQLIETGPNY